MQQAPLKKRRKMCTCCFGDGTPHYRNDTWCRLPYPVIHRLLQYLRISCSAKNDAHLCELRISTMLLRYSLDQTHFYDGVAIDSGVGWVWLHKFHIISLTNQTFKGANLEWSFTDDRKSALFDDVHWAYIRPHHAARVASDVVCEGAVTHSNVLATEGKCRLLRRNFQ